MDIYKAVDKLDDLQIDQISQIIQNNKPQEPAAAEGEGDELAGEDADLVKDLPAEEDKMTSVSAVKPSPS